MARKGPRPLPVELKLLRGNPGKRPIPLPEGKAPTGATAPPELLGEALAEFRRVTPLLEQLGLLTQIDHASLVGYCLSWEDLLWAVKTIRVEGRVTESGNGTAMPHPAVGIQRAAMAGILKFSAEFGMTPAARAHVKIVLGGSEREQEKRFFGGAKATGPA